MTLAVFGWTVLVGAGLYVLCVGGFLCWLGPFGAPRIGAAMVLIGLALLAFALHLSPIRVTVAA